MRYITHDLTLFRGSEFEKLVTMLSTAGAIHSCFQISKKFVNMLSTAGTIHTSYIRKFSILFNKEVDYTMIEKGYSEIKQRIEPMFQSSKNKDVIIDIILNG